MQKQDLQTVNTTKIWSYTAFAHEEIYIAALYSTAVANIVLWLLELFNITHLIALIFPLKSYLINSCKCKSYVRLSSYFPESHNSLLYK